jgi:p-hydroxybenzoic acid efflux pump subunit AaeA
MGVLMKMIEMKKLARRSLRILPTLVLLIIALILGRMLWVHYMDSPWTRDGRVRADVVSVAPDVSGLVTEVAVHDNQFVHKGDLLLRIDDVRYRQALAQAEALVSQRRSMLEIKQREDARRATLDDQVVSREIREDTHTGVGTAKAALDEAVASRDLARTNLDRTVVRSPVEGWVSNLLVRPGDYAQSGSARLAVIDRNSFWVYGYFEENKLPLMQVGDPVEIQMLGSDRILQGHVESLARGITDRDNPSDARLLANVNPNFNWVRLAQRVPVHIHIDQIPEGMTLVAGTTCSVVVKPRK